MSRRALLTGIAVGIGSLLRSLRIGGLLSGIIVGIAGCSAGGTQSGAGQDGGCTGFCANANTFLTSADVNRIMAQAIQEAQARGVTNATFVVADRTGFILEARRLGGPSQITITSNRTPAVAAPFSRGSLEGVVITDNGTVNGAVAVPNVNASGLAAASKAITAAYLSSEGNAFSTRTANQIVQENFNPGERARASGPLFGVQFSQLACSDLAVITNDPANPGGVRAAKVVDGPAIAPHAAPLGLSADPGGLPLYKGGTPVGGIGVISDQIYGIDRIISDIDQGVATNDEAIALAGTFGFAAPTDRLANRITVDGKTLRFTDVEPDLIALQSVPANAAGNQAALLAATTRQDIGVQARGNAFFNAAAISPPPHNGAAFGVPADQIVPGSRFSGIVPASAVNAFTGQAAFAARDAFVLTNAAGDTNAYQPRAGTEPAGNALTQTEVVQILSSALDVANAARAQIRRPVNSQMRATISVVDVDGRILGIVRTRDAPLFGTDVSLQKARTAAFFSRTTAATQLNNGRVGQSDTPIELTANTFGNRVLLAQTGAAADVAEVHQAIGGTALTDGIAFSDRSGGNLSRPFYPDGVGTIPGPLSNPFTRWSPFATGLQLELVFEEIIGALFSLEVPSPAGNAGDIQVGCSTRHQITGLQNGIQIFPGSVPIYRGTTLVGAIGVSGDGVDQDDMVSFLGVHNAGVLLGGAIGNAPTNIRADQLTVGGVNLRYVQCPQGPFLNSTAQNVCQGR